MAILAAEEGAPDGHLLVPLDTNVRRRMLDVKSVALQVLRLFATDHEAVLEIGRCRGFEVRVLCRRYVLYHMRFVRSHVCLCVLCFILW